MERACLLAGWALLLVYAWIMDDAYVYFRYADNFALYNHGLVWNAGEYVEGFSSPAWALLLCGVRLLRIDPWIFVLGFGVLAFSVFWYLACLINRGFLPRGRDVESHNLPLIYLSFNYAVLCYFTSGLESPLINVTAAAYAAAILWPRSRIFQVALGMSPLVRHEFLLPLLLFLGWSAFVRKIRPLTALGAFVFSVGGYGLFRVGYYADFLPNTYYLKDTTWIGQGLLYVYDAVIPYFTPAYIALALLLAWMIARWRSGALLLAHRGAMLLLALSVAVYVVRIGGDPRHFRYLAFSYILGVLATGGLLESALSVQHRLRPRTVTIGLAVFALGVGLCYPRQLSRHPVFRSGYKFEHTTIAGINDAAWHRLHPKGITPPLFSTMNRSVEQERTATEQRGPENPLAVIKAGNCRLAYMQIATPVIQEFGLTDPFLARTEMPAERPGHKFGLRPLAGDIQRIRLRYGFKPGAFDRAIEDAAAPGWVIGNINAIRRIEAKAFNAHRFVQNLEHALASSPRIDPDYRSERAPN